jgi:hypothetical protein
MSDVETQTPVLHRNDVVRLWGTPDATEGSLNDPRIRLENGIAWNEKWVYKQPGGEPSRPRQRVLYWQRYDFVAAERIEQDGHSVRESAAEILGR